VQGNQAYGPYGNSQYQAGAMGTAKGFTGQYQDATGLDYYNARYYDPVVGRFLSADTVQGNGMGMDPYAYVGGNPETNTDPTGQAVCYVGECEAGGGAGVPPPRTGGDEGACDTDIETCQGINVTAPLPSTSVTVGNTTYTYYPGASGAAGELTEVIDNPNGGSTFYTLLPGTAAYNAAMSIVLTSPAALTPAAPPPPPAPLNSVRYSQFRAHQQHHKLQQSQDETTPRENTSTSSTPAPATGGTGENPPPPATEGAGENPPPPPPAAPAGFPGENSDDLGTPRGFANNPRLARHFNDHGADFGADTPAEYQQQAINFMSGTPDANELQLQRPGGDYVRFNQTTGEFGIATPDGTIRTYYDISGRANPLDYFLRQFR
jgi:RHS repeat-associated protein